MKHEAFTLFTGQTVNDLFVLFGAKSCDNKSLCFTAGEERRAVSARKNTSESSAELRKQVLAARAIQAQRYAAPGYEDVRCNAQLTAGQVRRICRMTPAAEQLLRASYETLGLSARAHDRILRVARTIADLSGKRLLDEDSLLEALQYRAQEKVDLTF